MANTKKYVSLDKLELYDEKIKGVISAGDTATLTAANSYADGLATNYDAAGSAASALADANSYTDGKIATVDATVAGVKTTAEKGVSDAAAAKSAADAAQAAADAAQGEVDALEAYVGTIPEGYTEASVVAYIDKKAAETLAAASGNSTETAASVKAALDTYKTENDKAVAANAAAAAAAQTAADNAQAAADAAQGEVDALEQTHATDKAALEAEDARIVGLVEAEASARAEADEAIDARLVEVEAFFKLAEGEKLDAALDTLVEIQNYVTTEGAAADQMVLDIAANAKAIEDMDAAYKAADEAIDGRLDVLEAIDHDAYIAADTALKTELNGEIAKKADSTALASAVEALEGVDAGQETRIAALEAKFGGAEGSVEDQIADAKQAAIDAAAADATAKANAAESAAKTYADGLNTTMSGRVDALEAIDHDHANKAELDLIASGDKAKWDAAAAIAHEHGNKGVIDGITAENITTWNTVTSKAAQSDLTAVSDRVTTIETWHSNFVEVSEEEINGLFA